MNEFKTGDVVHIVPCDGIEPEHRFDDDKMDRLGVINGHYGFGYIWVTIEDDSFNLNYYPEELVKIGEL